MISRREFLSGCVSVYVGVGLGSQVFVTDKTPDVDWVEVDELLEMFDKTEFDVLEDNFNLQLLRQRQQWEDGVYEELNRRCVTGEPITEDLWDAYGQCGGPVLYDYEHNPETQRRVANELNRIRQLIQST